MEAKRFIKSFFKKYLEQDVPVELDLWPAIYSKCQNPGGEPSNVLSGTDRDGSPKANMTRLSEVLQKFDRSFPSKQKESSMDNDKQARGVPVTRRDFLKVSGVTAATAAAIGTVRQPVLRTLEEIAPGKTNAGTTEQVFHGVCKPNCFASCGVNVHVRDGKIVKISPADFPDKRFNRTCLRGLTHVQRTYNPDRIKYPMKRAGERGEDKWERISWEEAITTITDKWKQIRTENGDYANAFLTGSGNYGSIQNLKGRLQNLIGATSMSIDVDMGSLLGLNRVKGWGGAWTGNDEPDLVNSKTMIAWGSNLTNAQIHSWHFVADAIEAGMKLIVIDPVFNILASKAHEYVAIRPGSDAALILSMMQVILSENLQNVPFLLAHTVAPFLVREDTGKFLRLSEIGIEPLDGPADAAGNPTKIDPIAVWNPDTKTAVAGGSLETPALEGAFTIKGIKVRTAFDLLKEEVNQYPPEVATKLTDIPEETIRHLAMVSVDGPVNHYVGFGAQAYDNGVHSAHAIATLAAITGNIGYPGANVGAQITGYAGANGAFAFPTGAAGGAISNLVYRKVLETGTFQGKPYALKSLFVTHGNPANTLPNTNEWLTKFAPSFDLIVVADMTFTDTARYADIILPVSDWFETMDVVGSGQHYYVQISEQAIQPLYETKPDSDIIRMLAEKMGVGEYFDKTDEEYLQEMIATPYSEAVGISVETLKEKKAIRHKKIPYIDCENNVFYTPTGKMEFYVESPTPMALSDEELDIEREHLPRFFPPMEAWPENPLHDKYPLVLLSERPRFRVHSQWFGVPWLRELDPEPFVKINVKDAAKRGIKNGDYVEVFNERGSAVVKAVLTQGVKVGAMVFAKGWQRKQYVAGDLSTLASSKFDPFAVNGSFMDELVEVRKWNGEV